MSLTLQQKQALFSKIQIDTTEGIKRDHKAFAYRLKGWCKNKFHAALGMSEQIWKLKTSARPGHS